ncbi:pyridoxamine 5'-phosphate oxidase family protein [Heliorestis convoluta]|uniref:Pyridoxamine 5'-phosphate oxidase family protein n=1 Tax=Heliorestis convoluta TaxID=356322 RepID=A0A5Q2N4P9_9FIRM|nr:pyridoxamine 5'-phosphate oxidase family protein [Heliorestis convoluta]QGG48586.1 pyridoxamine 5'-phosphate oxidase family protein [Heliorestis convoluta]
MKAYFEKAQGTGILSTADGEGNVNAALYATPHFMEDGTVAFIMRERLTYQNVQANPKACYLFKEAHKIGGYRLYLTKVKEEVDSELLFEIRRKETHIQEDEKLYLVYFNVDKILPILGGKEVTSCPHSKGCC